MAYIKKIILKGFINFLLEKFQFEVAKLNSMRKMKSVKGTRRGTNFFEVSFEARKWKLLR